MRRWDLRVCLHRIAVQYQQEARDLYLADLLRFAVLAPHLPKGKGTPPNRPKILDWML